MEENQGVTSVGLTHLSRLERGLGNPTASMIEGLADKLRCSPFVLLGLDHNHAAICSKELHDAHTKHLLQIEERAALATGPRSLNLDELSSPLGRFFGARLRFERTRQGLLHVGLAGRSGVSTSYISLAERGNANPTLRTMVQLAAGLRLPLNSLFAGMPGGDVGGSSNVLIQ